MKKKDENQATLPVVTKVTKRTSFKIVKPQYVYIPRPVRASFAEAKQRCIAGHLQLPEIYSLHQHEDLSLFMQQKGVEKCFAGIQPDLFDVTHRFISTGFPVIRTPHNIVWRAGENRSLPMVSAMDDFEARFIYGNDNKLCNAYEDPSIVNSVEFKLGSHSYRETMRTLIQVIVS